MLKIDNFNITIKPIRNFLYECLVVNKEGGNTFGIIVQSPNPPTPEGVYNIFTTQPKNFFIEADVITTSEQPVVVGVVTDTIHSGSVNKPTPVLTSSITPDKVTE
jgi:hypothetical protein